MKIAILAVGRLRSKPVQVLCDDYLARLKHYGPAEVQEVKAANAGAPAQMAADESVRLLKALEPTDQVLVLDERGIQLSSVELCQTLKQHELRGTKRLVIILGGAFGFNDEVRRRGRVVSLSKLTLPHELCRVLVLEQLYRARTIQHGQPYHHA